MMIKRTIFAMCALALLGTGCANDAAKDSRAAADSTDQLETSSNSRRADQSDYITQELDWVRFQDLSMEIPGDLKIVLGDQQKISLFGPPNMMEEVQVVFDKEKVRFFASTQFKEEHTVDITLTTPGLKYVYMLGSGNVDIDGRTFQYSDASFISRGANETKIHSLDRDHMAVLLNGTGSITLSGKADKLSAYVNGQGNIYANDLKSQQAKAKIAGRGIIELTASDNLEAFISGTGNVRYKGKPKITEKITGNGTVVASK